MSGAAIVIEIAAGEASSPYAAALVEACTRGSHADMHCSLPSDADPSPPPMVAVVTWEDEEHRSVEIQVGVHRANGPEWSARHVVFTDTDAELERWRAVGLVIATLAGEVSGASPNRPPPAPAPAVPKTPPAPRPLSPRAPPEAEPAWIAQASAEMSRGASGSFGAYGSALRVSRRLLPRFLFGTASVRYELAHPNQVDLSLTSVTLGAAAELPSANLRWALEGRLEGGMTFEHAALSDPVARAASGSQSGTVWSIREGVTGVWWWSEWVGLAVSAEAFQANRATAINSQTGVGPTSLIAKLEPLGWSAGLGLRVGFGR